MKKNKQTMVYSRLFLSEDYRAPYKLIIVLMGTEPTTVFPAGFTLPVSDAPSRDTFCFSLLFLNQVAFFNTEERSVLHNSSRAASRFSRLVYCFHPRWFSSLSLSSHEPLKGERAKGCVLHLKHIPFQRWLLCCFAWINDPIFESVSSFCFCWLIFHCSRLWSCSCESLNIPLLEKKTSFFESLLTVYSEYIHGSIHARCI